MRYYHFDDLGSTRLVTDSTGSVTDRYDYDAYGAVIWHECDSGSVGQPYQYVGRLGYYTCWQEPDFGLLHLGVRFYDPQAGRFTQRDVARAGGILTITGPETRRSPPTPPDWLRTTTPGFGLSRPSVRTTTATITHAMIRGMTSGNLVTYPGTAMTIGQVASFPAAIWWPMPRETERSTSHRADVQRDGIRSVCTRVMTIFTGIGRTRTGTGPTSPGSFAQRTTTPEHTTRSRIQLRMPARGDTQPSVGACAPETSHGEANYKTACGIAPYGRIVHNG